MNYNLEQKLTKIMVGIMNRRNTPDAATEIFETVKKVWQMGWEQGCYDEGMKREESPSTR